MHKKTNVYKSNYIRGTKIDDTTLNNEFIIEDDDYEKMKSKIYIRYRKRVQTLHNPALFEKEMNYEIRF